MELLAKRDIFYLLSPGAQSSRTINVLLNNFGLPSPVRKSFGTLSYAVQFNELILFGKSLVSKFFGGE